MARRPSAFAFSFPRLRPGVRALVVATAVASIAISALVAWGPGEAGRTLLRAVVLQPALVFHGHLWKLLTYPLLVLDPVTLIFTCLWVWWMGSDLEEAWGARRMLLHWAGSVAVGGLSVALLGLLLPTVGDHIYLGGWTTVMPLLVGFALSAPGRDFNLVLLPSFKARLLIPIAAGIMLLSALMTGSVVPLLAPLFTELAAVALADLRTASPRKLWLRLRVWWIAQRMRRSKLRVVKLPGDDQLPRPRSGGRGSDDYLH